MLFLVLLMELGVSFHASSTVEAILPVGVFLILPCLVLRSELKQIYWQFKSVIDRYDGFFSFFIVRYELFAKIFGSNVFEFIV